MRLRRTIEADDTLDRRKQAITLKIPAQGFNERNRDLSPTMKISISYGRAEAPVQSEQTGTDWYQHSASPKAPQ